MLKLITIILPIAYRGGSLRVTKTIAQMIKHGSRNAGQECAVRIAILAGVYDIPSEFRELLALGVEIREYGWREATPAEVEAANRNQGRRFDVIYDEYHMLDDGVDNCMDADLWLVVSDRLSKPLSPIRPYAVFATDYIQRYVPGIFPEGQMNVDLASLRTVRQADAVIVTTPQTRMDVISYAGVPARKVQLAPMDFAPPLLPGGGKGTSEKDYFIWPTNASPHKNHISALKALELYYQNGGQLKARVVGTNSQFLAPSSLYQGGHLRPYLDKVRSMIASSPILSDNIEILGEVTDATYADLICAAAFLWHPAIYDNGTFAIAEAAWLGCPSLSSRYPQMEYIESRFSIPLRYFDPSSVDDMARALTAMELEADATRLTLPSQEALQKHSWQSYAAEYWKMLVGIVI